MVLLPSVRVCVCVCVCVCVYVCETGECERQRLMALPKIKASLLARQHPRSPHHSSKIPYNSLIEWEGDFYDVS